MAADEAKARGNGHFKKGEWEAAVKEYTNAIELDGSQHSYYSNRSACYANLGKFEEALADGEKCIELKPEWGKGYSRKGFALFKMSRFDKAQTCYEEGLKHDPKNQSLVDGVRQCKEHQGSMQQQMLLMKLMQNPETAAYLQDKELMGQFMSLLSNPMMMAQGSNPLMKDPRIQKMLSVIMGGMDKAEPGGGNDQPAPRKPRPRKKTPPPPEPKTPAEILKDEGTALYKKKKFPEAYEKYKAAHDLEPDAPIYVLNMSAVRFMEKRYEESETLCKEVIQLAKKTSETGKWTGKAYARLASVEEKRGNTEKAEEHLQNSLLEFSDPKTRDRLKKFQRAKREKERQEYLDPEKALEHKAKGNELFKEAKWPEAVKEYTEALRRDPKNHTVYSNRATCYAKLMAFDQSLKDCQSCLDIDPTFTKAWIRKGRIHHLKKEYHRAMSCYDEALKLQPHNQDVLKYKMETQVAIQNNQSKEVDEKEQQRILSDPKIQEILRDPEIDFILKRAQADPQVLVKAMKSDPEKAKKIQTLFDAGVIRTG